MKQYKMKYSQRGDAQRDIRRSHPAAHYGDAQRANGPEPPPLGMLNELYAGATLRHTTGIDTFNRNILIQLVIRNPKRR